MEAPFIVDKPVAKPVEKRVRTEKQLANDERMRVVAGTGRWPDAYVRAFVHAAAGRSPQALEELRVYRGVLILEGKIVSGDYNKLRDFLGNKKSNFEKISGGVFLASPGGSIVEALKIGRLIRALRLSTDAPPGPATGSPKFGESLITPSQLINPKVNYGCASACFFVYVAGVYRHLSWAGRLGVHRPYQLESEAQKLNVDQALNRNWQVRTMVQKYLAEMSVPDKYVDLIYSIPSNELHWITQNEYDSDLQGFIPEMRDWVGTKCGPQTNEQRGASVEPDAKPPSIENSKASVRENKINDLGCWMRVKAQLSNEAWNKAFPSN
jgi:hypothetical protein